MAPQDGRGAQAFRITGAAPAPYGCSTRLGHGPAACRTRAWTTASPTRRSGPTSSTRDASLLWEAWLDDLTDRLTRRSSCRRRPRRRASADYGDFCAALPRRSTASSSPTRAPRSSFRPRDPAYVAAIQRAASDAGLDLATPPRSTRVSRLQADQGPAIRRDASPRPTSCSPSAAAATAVTWRRATAADAVQAAEAALRLAKEAGRSSAGKHLRDVNARLLRAPASNDRWHSRSPRRSARTLHEREPAGHWLDCASTALPRHRPAAARREGAPLDVDQPLARPTRGKKNTPAYNAHCYPTKVPPEAIEPYVAHHTRPGDLVLDPFCGSGMTGLAGTPARP